ENWLNLLEGISLISRRSYHKFAPPASVPRTPDRTSGVTQREDWTPNPLLLQRKASDPWRILCTSDLGSGHSTPLPQTKVPYQLHLQGLDFLRSKMRHFSTLDSPAVC